MKLRKSSLINRSILLSSVTKLKWPFYFLMRSKLQKALS